MGFGFVKGRSGLAAAAPEAPAAMSPSVSAAAAAASLSSLSSSTFAANAFPPAPPPMPPAAAKWMEGELSNAPTSTIGAPPLSSALATPPPPPPPTIPATCFNADANIDHGCAPSRAITLPPPPSAFSHSTIRRPPAPPISSLSSVQHLTASPASFGTSLQPQPQPSGFRFRTLSNSSRFAPPTVLGAAIHDALIGPWTSTSRAKVSGIARRLAPPGSLFSSMGASMRTGSGTGVRLGSCGGSDRGKAAAYGWGGEIGRPSGHEASLSSTSSSSAYEPRSRSTAAAVAGLEDENDSVAYLVGRRELARRQQMACIAAAAASSSSASKSSSLHVPVAKTPAVAQPQPVSQVTSPDSLSFQQQSHHHHHHHHHHHRYHKPASSAFSRNLAPSPPPLPVTMVHLQVKRPVSAPGKSAAAAAGLYSPQKPGSSSSASQFRVLPNKYTGSSASKSGSIFDLTSSGGAGPGAAARNEVVDLITSSSSDDERVRERNVQQSAATVAPDSHAFQQPASPSDPSVAGPQPAPSHIQPLPAPPRPRRPSVATPAQPTSYDLSGAAARQRALRRVFHGLQLCWCTTRGNVGLQVDADAWAFRQRANEAWATRVHKNPDMDPESDGDSRWGSEDEDDESSEEEGDADDEWEDDDPDLAAAGGEATWPERAAGKPLELLGRRKHRPVRAWPVLVLGWYPVGDPGAWVDAGEATNPFERPSQAGGLGEVVYSVVKLPLTKAMRARVCVEKGMDPGEGEGEVSTDELVAKLRAWARQDLERSASGVAASNGSGVREGEGEVPSCTERGLSWTTHPVANRFTESGDDPQPYLTVSDHTSPFIHGVRARALRAYRATRGRSGGALLPDFNGTRNPLLMSAVIQASAICGSWEVLGPAALRIGPDVLFPGARVWHLGRTSKHEGMCIRELLAKAANLSMVTREVIKVDVLPPSVDQQQRRDGNESGVDDGEDAELMAWFAAPVPVAKGGTTTYLPGYRLPDGVGKVRVTVRAIKESFAADVMAGGNGVVNGTTIVASGRQPRLSLTNSATKQYTGEPSVLDLDRVIVARTNPREFRWEQELVPPCRPETYAALVDLVSR
ncbi:hypothetical protein BCR44DRAFT_1437811 [Catenaria anguillulae PL171]|uniref:Uncharacterized protein n=1 Tax=Catenaria anguillulae PL171 TaxID=765915 RepID=A0A1Y2HIT6_9FUNG|nr:hypothetical protein BCR44DRAFT_1437811 [Catenaria anguillulae PL171]